jgi:hypothetical protein
LYVTNLSSDELNSPCVHGVSPIIKSVPFNDIFLIYNSVFVCIASFIKISSFELLISKLVTVAAILIILLSVDGESIVLIFSSMKSTKIFLVLFYK